MSNKKTIIEYLLTANSTKLVKGYSKAQQGVESFNQVTGNSTRVISSMRNQLLGLAGAATGLSTLAQANQIMLDASAAGYNLEASLKAANRQFEVGSAQEWEAVIKGLSEELVVYSDTSLTNAAAKTVDMTKRLGMSADQMRTIISLTGDLSAGKTTLEDGVERVTAALRGEAEASEYLGLTLNEDYVKSWYYANDATAQAWKDLTDVEKAQIRYNVLLEQATPLQGRAAGSVENYAGALQLIKKEVTDSIAQNENLIVAMTNVATILRENADEIAGFASAMADGAAWIIEFIANNHELIAEVAKYGLIFGAGAKAIGLLTTGFRGVNAAMLTMTGTRLLPWFTTLIQGAGGGAVALRGLAAGFGKVTMAIGVFYAAYKAGEWLTMRNEIKAVAEATAELDENRRRLDTETGKVAEKLGMAGASFDDLMEAERQGLIRYDDLTGEWVKVAQKVTDSTETVVAAIGAVETAAAAVGQDDAAVPEWANKTNDPDNVFGLQPEDEPQKKTKKSKKTTTPVEQAEQLTLEQQYGFTAQDVKQFQAAYDQNVAKVAGEDLIGSIAAGNAGMDGKALSAIASSLESAGQHDLNVQLKDKEKDRPTKVVELRFSGGTLQGSEESVEALLQQLEAAGATA